MDWIKVKTRHILHEYNDLTPHEYKAWMKAMALTAVLGKMPTRSQLTEVIFKRTLDALEMKLKSHSTDIETILKKVLDDVDRIEHRKSVSRSTSDTYRKKQETPKLKSDTSCDTTEKRREEKRREDDVYETQIKNLLTQFSSPIKTLVKEFIGVARGENKSGKMSLSREARIVNEIYNLEIACQNKEWFEEALKTAVKNEAPNINYVKKVYESSEKKKRIMFKNIEAKNKAGWDEGVRKGAELYKKSQADSKSIQQK